MKSVRKMIRLHQLVILAFWFLCFYSASAQERQPFTTSLLPSEVEGQALEVPRGELRKIEFAVRYVPSGTEYRPELEIDEIRINIGRNSFESRHLLSIVQRSCADSDKPGERCELLQVTVNGANMEISDLEGRRLRFVVVGDEPLSQEEISGPITLKIVDRPDPEETTTTKPETTTEAPVPTTTSRVDISIVDPNARIGQCEPVETIVPWVFVAVLAALLIVTFVILILVICKHRNREDKADPEKGQLPLSDRTATSAANKCVCTTSSTTPENGETNSQPSSCKSSSSELQQ